MGQDLDNHPLGRDFPELKDKIRELKTENGHFARLHREYEEVDKAVIRFETGLEHSSSAELEQKKKLRVLLKDELYAMLSVTA